MLLFQCNLNHHLPQRNNLNLQKYIKIIKQSNICLISKWISWKLLFQIERLFLFWIGKLWTI